MWILQHVGLVPKNGHEDLTQTNIGNVTLGSFVTDLLHPTTEVVQGIWVDVPVGDELGEVEVLKEIWLEIDVHCAPIAWLSFIVLSTYHLLYCPLIPRAPSLVLPGDWIYPQITRELVPGYYQIEDISDSQLILNIYIPYIYNYDQTI